MHKISPSRRQFLQSTAAVLAASALGPSFAPAATPAAVPAYLKGRESAFAANPRATAVHWFTDSIYGLFVHYTLASLMPGGKQDFLKNGDPKKLFQQFTADKFDAGAIADLAVAAEMKYINFTTKHLGDLYMYRTSVSDFTSLRTPAKRDLVAEMAEACRKRGLGLFFYVPPDTARTDGDNLARNRTTMHELLTQYGPVAGIWFDSSGPTVRAAGKYAQISSTYALIRSIQPQTLISYKSGATGEEDFLAPEHSPNTHHGSDPKFASKPIEVCDTMQMGSAQWVNNESARHMSADQVMAKLTNLHREGHNYLINTGLRGDGSIHPTDSAALREVGERLRKSGWRGPPPPPLPAKA